MEKSGARGIPPDSEGSYESIPNSELRDILGKVDAFIAEKGITNLKPVEPTYILDTVGNFVGLKKRTMQKLQGRISRYETVPRIRVSEPDSERHRMMFGPDDVRAAAALAFVLKEKNKKERSDRIKFVGLEAETREALGSHPLSKIIQDPRPLGGPRIGS